MTAAADVPAGDALHARDLPTLRDLHPHPHPHPQPHPHPHPHPLPALRDARPDDLPALAELLGAAVALPTQPHERLLLADAPGAPPLAMLRLVPDIGAVLPRFWYHVGHAVHAAPELGLFHRQSTLLLGNDLTGCTELAEIAVAPGQGAALQALLAWALQTAAAAPAHYAGHVIAELPGAVAGDGSRPFWQGLGRHFYARRPQDAELRHGPQWRSHVAALLPRQLIYASFLSADAQAAVGAVDAPALPLRRALEAAGLQWRDHIRIDDGGAVLETVLPTADARSG